MEPEAPQVVGRLPSPRAQLARAVGTITKRSASRALDSTPLLRRNVVLERSRIAAYAALCGYTEAQGVPLTFPHLLAFPLHVMAMTRPSFPLPVIGIVHLGNRIVQHAKLHPDDVVSVAVRLGEWLAHEKGQAFTIEATIVRDEAAIWESRSTYLRIGAEPRLGEAYAAPDLPDTPFSTWQRWSLPADLGRRYARISDDWNPIHLSRLSAQLLGQRRAVAHGMWLKARALAAVLPEDPVVRAEADVAFKTPAHLPGAVALLAARAPEGVFFELRDSRDEKPHLRGSVRNVVT